MKHWETELFEYGLKDEKIIHVKDVDNGINCNCVCPACDAKLIAVNNIKVDNLRPYFRHHVEGCNFKHYQESVVHRLAKDIIEEQGFVVVPYIDYNYLPIIQNFMTSIEPDEWNDIYTTPSMIRAKIRPYKLNFEKIRIEKKEGQLIPDIVLDVNGKKLLVEIAYSHFCERDKIDFIKKTKLDTIEIDLSRMNPNSTKNNIQNEINNIKNSKWLFNNRKLIELKQLIVRVVEIRNSIGEQAITIKTYVNLKRVYKCPIRKLKSKEFISVDEVCSFCEFFLGKIVEGTLNDRYSKLMEEGLIDEYFDEDELVERFGKSILDRNGYISCAGNLQDRLHDIFYQNSLF